MRRPDTRTRADAGRIRFTNPRTRANESGRSRCTLDIRRPFPQNMGAGAQRKVPMSRDRIFTRRDLLQKSATLGALAIFGAAACSKAPKPLSCTDTTALSPADMTIRTSLAYIDNSNQPGKQCSGCQQFLPAAPDACGACKIVKGPINPGGYCKSFVAKPS